MIYLTRVVEWCFSLSMTHHSLLTTSRRPVKLVSRVTTVLLVVGVCAIAPADAASASNQARRITQVKAVGTPTTTGTTVSVSARVKNVTEKRKGSAHAKVFLVGSKRSYGLKSVKVPGIRAGGHVTVTAKRKAPVSAPAGRYAVRVCLVGHPDHCRTSGRTVEIAPSRLEASPTALSFGSTVKGTSTPAQQVRITNTGQSRTGKLSAAVVDGPAFAVSGSSCQVALTPGASCTVDVRFTPQAVGASTGTLQVTDGDTRTSVALTGAGTQLATLAIAPDDVLFATTTIGDTTASQTITVTNTGDFASGKPTIGLTGDDDQFDVTATTCDGALPPGTSCTIDVAYSPTGPGPAKAVLTAAAAPGGTVTANLTGAGQTQPALSISETAYDYGYSDAPAEHVFTVTNTGDATTGVPAATIDGDSAFDITSNTCTTPIAGGATCSVGVTYAGTGTSSQSAQLTVVATRGGTVASDLTGSPVAVSVSPATRDFGAVDVGSSSDEASFVLTNHRLTSILVGGESVTGPFPVQSSCNGTTIAAGQSCTFSVTFSPTAAGPASGDVTYSAGGTDVRVDLTGSGATPANLTVAAATPDFGAWAVGGSPGTSDVTITNTGTKSTSTVSVSIDGADTDDFTLDASGCPAVLSGGASCSATVTFAPQDFGDKTATLSVNGAPANTVDLAGLGAPAGVTLYPNPYDYGQVAVGGAAYKTFRVVNTTENGENMNSASSGPPFPLELNQDFTCVLVVSTIQPHRWCTMTISFKPQSTGTFTTTLTAGGINFNTSTLLSGEGVASLARLRAARPTSAEPPVYEIKDGKPVAQ